MIVIVERPKLSLWEKLYLPAILSGMTITLRHLIRTLCLMIFPKKLFNRLTGREKKRSLMELSERGLVTMCYPEEKWPLPDGYRGAPLLVKDEAGRTKCVSCQLCEFVCPPRAIRIEPGEISADDRDARVEKRPRRFEINMLRCIYCGLCEEVCPEEAIFLKKDVPVLTGSSRREMIHDKEKLLELGGVLPRPIRKWEGK